MNKCLIDGGYENLIPPTECYHGEKHKYTECNQCEYYNDVLTPEEFKEKMQEIHDDKTDYQEGWHERMDNLMCDLLTKLGYKDGIEIFYNTDKWYS